MFVSGEDIALRKLSPGITKREGKREGILQQQWEQEWEEHQEHKREYQEQQGQARCELDQTKENRRENIRGESPECNSIKLKNLQNVNVRSINNRLDYQLVIDGSLSVS